jgi:PTS system nitrogen regulatory IIA component
LCVEEGCDTAALLTEECFVFPEDAAGENVAGVRWKVEPDRICQIVDTVIDLSAPSKTSLLQDLARRAAPVVNVDANFLFNALLQREELGSTGVGNGVALPHVRLEQVKNPFAIIVRLKHPIDFDAVDGQPVDLVCLVLLSKENESAQLNALAGIARRLRRPELLEELRRAPNRVVLYNLMTGRTGQYRSQWGHFTAAKIDRRRHGARSKRRELPKRLVTLGALAWQFDQPVVAFISSLWLWMAISLEFICADEHIGEAHHGRFAMPQELSRLRQVLAFAVLKASAAVAHACRTTMADPADRYRPEAHYMRGPGPKWRAKHAQSPRQIIWE